MHINLYRYQLPLTMPLTINGSTIVHREGFYVEIEGHWGEISPLPNDLSNGQGDSDLSLEQDLLVAVERLRHGLAYGARLPAVQFGLDCALAKVSSAPLTVQQTPHSLPLFSLPLLEGPRDPLVRAWRCRRVHPERAWLTLTGDVHYDASLVRELCLLAPSVRLVLDAAGRLDKEQIGGLWQRIDGSRIDWLLDPSADLPTAKALAEQYSMPVALDLARYSDFTSATAPNLAIAELAFAKAMIIRPAQLGGLAHNQQLAAQARDLGLEVMLGDSLQSGLGQHQLAHLSHHWLPGAALALGRCRYLLDSGINKQGQPAIAGLTPL
ncbi:o-succinylbenzoic acid (OSB) synthetase [Oceanisphaera sp. IT1-181]|uniref:o-succinylbenzoic acid (OSB) synthetase n=1 Tax=Oceanisphaera sp. IT1-181 TaxID=3081199 RepID=UPI0029C9B687|nr:o-succinylbenzoic acid (OSB) synthetase [Oceanisphaera sp. IT1-181]